MRELWSGLEPEGLLVATKLLTGGFRVGVAQGLVIRALARLSGLEEPLLAHRLMGASARCSQAFRQLIAPAGAAERPQPPLSLLSGLAAAAAEGGAAPFRVPTADWLCEWKWDGIRGQLIRRGGEGFLWSRGEELINRRFPELIAAAAGLADGTVLDGEVIVWPEERRTAGPVRPAAAAAGPQGPGRRLLAECPAVSWPTTCWSRGASDCAPGPWAGGGAALEALIGSISGGAAIPAAGPCALAAAALEAWEQLEAAAASGPRRRRGGPDAQGGPLPLSGRPAGGATGGSTSSSR